MKTEIYFSYEIEPFLEYNDLPLLRKGMCLDTDLGKFIVINEPTIKLRNLSLFKEAQIVLVEEAI